METQETTPEPLPTDTPTIPPDEEQDIREEESRPTQDTVFAEPEIAKPSKWRLPAIVGALALVAGGAVGYGIASPQISEQRERADAAEAQAQDKQAKYEQVQLELDTTKGALATTQDALAESRTKVDDAQAELDAREAAVAEREAAVQATEDQIAANSFGPGIRLVGTEIQPGTYRSENAGGSCYWARLSGTSGDFDELLANDNPDGPTVVTINPTDVAFESSRCGTWTLVQ